MTEKIIIQHENSVRTTFKKKFPRSNENSDDHIDVKFNQYYSVLLKRVQSWIQEMKHELKQNDPELIQLKKNANNFVNIWTLTHALAEQWFLDKIEVEKVDISDIKLLTKEIYEEVLSPLLKEWALIQEDDRLYPIIEKWTKIITNQWEGINSAQDILVQ